MQSNITLYAGWFAPRYTTSYVLNGGVWSETEEITYTLITANLNGENVFLYHPHMGEDGSATLYWYVQSAEYDRLFVDTLYQAAVEEVLEYDPDSGHWSLKPGITAVDDLPQDMPDTQGSRLVDHYFCYMGDNGLDETHNHEVYVNINSQVNTLLPEPAEPTRAGYRFMGWYYFDENETGEKIYLSDVLSSQQGLASYGEGYVYLDAVGDAHLVHEDGDGLFYYVNQIGYHFSYENGASIVSRSRELRAAWESAADVAAVVYHLVRPADVASQSTSFQVGDDTFSLEQARLVSIGSETYYLLKAETESHLFSGTTLTVNAWTNLTDSNSSAWLPQTATVSIPLDARVWKPSPAPKRRPATPSA